MEAICPRENATCVVYGLGIALHSLHLYCALLAGGFCFCCTRIRPQWHSNCWRGQNLRGTASLILGASWCFGAAVAALRPSDTVRLVAALVALLAWFAAAVLHVLLWSRRSAAPVLYLAIYWLLTAVSSAAIIWRHLLNGASANHIQVYIQGISTILALLVSAVDCICFYDEITKKHHGSLPETSLKSNATYKHNETHFYSKITFFWINSLLYRGYYDEPGEHDDFGELPEEEKSVRFYEKFKNIYKEQIQITQTNVKSFSLWRCYMRTIWPNFYIAGVLKLFGDIISVIPPLGLAIIIQSIEYNVSIYDTKSEVTIEEFLTNAYVMLFIVTLALIMQAVLSQNSTHLVTVEGTRLKTALQSLIYDKCMRLAPLSSADSESDEDSPLLHAPEDVSPTPSGILTNLISQDTYNITSCVWVCHYMWAIPLKVAVILYLLYTKLGVSALIGTAASVMVITPLQFYIGKKLSDNSKDISKCTDHRVSKMSEILHGINVIKLYVWEDLFNEKILQLREVELKMLNKDSFYWGLLTFTTQVSTILITVITFTLVYLLDNDEGLTVVNVLAGLALFNQLAIPLLILPFTVLMVIQAMVSTNRIEEFLQLPESNNVKEEKYEAYVSDEKRNQELPKCAAKHKLLTEENNEEDMESEDQFIDDQQNKSTFSIEQEYIIRFKNASFSWRLKDNSWLDVEDLDIPVGKLIMVVGSSGSGKSSLLSAILGEMYLERGDISYSRCYSTCYAGQPSWLLEDSIRNNILMGRPWSLVNYTRVLRATGLRPDLRLLPDGDRTQLGSHGAPLSGGQRVRVCVARCLYSGARLLALDEPLGALDAALARHIVARGLVPATRAGHTVIIATNRLELLHYADLEGKRASVSPDGKQSTPPIDIPDTAEITEALPAFRYVIAMEGGRVSDIGRPGSGSKAYLSNGCESTLHRWARLAAEARQAAARGGAGPPGGTAREREKLLKAISTRDYNAHNETTMGISEATGAHLLAEVPTCAGGSWRRTSIRARSALSRQLSSPPPSIHQFKWRREIRRAVSADESDNSQPRVHRALARWTPRTLHRLLSSDWETQADDIQTDAKEESTTIDTTFASVTSNGVGTNATNNSSKTFSTDEEPEQEISERMIWWEYARGCGWWGIAYWIAAISSQGLTTAADWWLSNTAARNSRAQLDNDTLWSRVCLYTAWCVGGAFAAGLAQASSTLGGAAARRSLHDRLLRATLRAPPHIVRNATLHRFSADIAVVDKKLTMAVTRCAQLALLCLTAVVINVVASTWTLLAFLPAFFCYIFLLTVYLYNARELQRFEAQSAARVVSLGAQTCTGCATVRACRLQSHMRVAFLSRLDDNHNALLLLNAANRWLGIALDLVGAGSVCVSLGTAIWRRSSGLSALAGTYSLLLPAFLTHLAKCCADLSLQLAAVERIVVDTNLPHEDYRKDCPIPSGWQRKGKIEFQNVTIRHTPDAPPVLQNVNLTINPGEKVAICGRSGIGKSSLLLSCAGACGVSNGRIMLDGVDIRHVPLHALRHGVVVLPQHSVMFSGTLRENLDPLGVHTDEEIWHSLKAVGLYDFVVAQSAGLECSVDGSGSRSGWSQGRAARACAARAALHARLAAALLLDEPGAALDAHAERDLLAALTAVAPNTTIITVAHRLSSVRNYDRVAVLEEGCVVEHGAMSTLLDQPSSRLARMLAAHTQPLT